MINSREEYRLAIKRLVAIWLERRDIIKAMDEWEEENINPSVFRNY